MALADYNLFLDDERTPGPGLKECVIVRDFWAFKKTLVQLGVPKYITFDHDLGDPKYTGKSCAEFLVCLMYDMDPADLKDFTYDVHSQNPVGAANIRAFLDQFLKEHA